MVVVNKPRTAKLHQVVRTPVLTEKDWEPKTYPWRQAHRDVAKITIAWRIARITNLGAP